MRSSSSPVSIAPSPASAGLPKPERTRAMAAISLAVCIATLDTSIVNTTLATIAAQLNASQADIIWIVTAYQLTMIAAMLPLASLGEKLGYRPVFLSGLALFTASSLACGLSPSFSALVAARALQGLGAAAVMSANTALVRSIYPEQILGRGLGINAFMNAFGLAAGPTAASLILFFASWHWLFYINVPICIVSFVLSWRALPLQHRANQKFNSQKFDGIAALLCAALFILIVHGLGAVSHKGAWLWVALQWALAAALAYALILRQRGHPAPMLPVDLFRNPVFSLSTLVAICAFITQGLALVALPFYFQTFFGKTQVETGLLITPWPIMGALMAPIAGALSDRYPAGLLGSLGLASLAGGIALLIFLPEHSPTLLVIAGMMLCGFGIGLFLSPNQRAIMSSAPPGRAGSASGILGLARLLGQATGAAIVALCLSTFEQAGIIIALYTGCAFALTGGILSAIRLLVAKKSGI